MRQFSAIVFFSLAFLSGCLFRADKIETLGLDRGAIGQDENKDTQAKAIVTAVSIVNDQLILDGSDLSSAKSVRITGPSGFDEVFTIESKSSSQLIANGLQNIQFAIGSAFNLIVNDAYGAATFDVTFTMQDGGISASMLSDMGAGIGHVLKFDGTSWVASDLSALTYAGNWNASANTPDLSVGGSAGEFYIVNNSGAYDLLGGTGTDSWSVGDWAIWNDVDSQWEKVDNATNVLSFNGRSGVVMPVSGDYTWAQIDKSTSSIGDITDVNVTGASSGQVLKWDGSEWVADTDETGGGVGSVTSSEILNLTIVNADVSASASIDQSKINNLVSDLAGKLPLIGGNLAGDINLGANDITFTSGLVDGVDISALDSQVTSNIATFSTKENSISAGTMNDYWRGDKTWQNLDNSAVGLGNVTNDAQIPLANRDNGALSTSTVDIPTSNAVKTYVDNAVSGLGSDVINSDGSVAMAANFDFGNNKALFKSDNTNYVELIAPNSLGSTYTLTFPISDGDASEVLITDGSGNLSWQTMNIGDITDVSAGVGLLGGGSSGALTLNVDVGTSSGNIVQLGAGGTLPAVDASLLTNLPDPLATVISGFSTGSNTSVVNTDTLESAIEKLQGQVDAVSGGTGDISGVTAGVGLTGGATSGVATLDVNVGTGANQIVQLDGSGNLPALDGSALTNLPSSLSETISGFSTGDNSDVTNTDSLIDALGKFQSQIDENESDLSDKLDKNGDSIDGHLTLNDESQLRLSDSGSANYLSIRSPATLGASYSLVLPTDDGDNGEFLTTNGSGVLSWSSVASSGDITSVTAGTGLNGGASSGAVTLNVDVGTGANQIVQLDGSGHLPALNGQALTNLPDPLAKVLSGFVTGSNTSVVNTDNLEVAIEKLQGQIDNLAGGGGGGDISSVIAGVGLTGGATSGDATIDIDVGTGANQIIQLDGSSRLPAVDGSLLTNLPGATATILTGFSTGADSSVVATDNILEAFEKLQGQVDARVSDDSITDSLTDVAPSHNAVYDALSTKADLAAINDYVQIAGDTMTGDLIMEAESPTLLFNSTSLSHGVTDFSPSTSTGFVIQTEDTGTGIMYGFSGDDEAPGLSINGVSFSSPDVGVPAISFAGVKKSGTDITSLSASDTVLSVANEDTTLFSIMGSGNVGIGTTDPQSELDVSGTINAEQICDETGSNCHTLNSGFSSGTVTSITGGDGLSNGPITGSGTIDINVDGSTIDINGSDALFVNVGTGADQIVQLDSSSRLPAVDGSLLTNLPDPLSTVISGFTTGANTSVVNTDTIEVAIEKLQGQIDNAGGGSGDITNVIAGTGLTGGATSGEATLNVNVGTGANQIVQLNGSSQLPAIDGSLLTNIPSGTSAALTGLGTGFDLPINSTDTVLEAFEKMQAQVSARVSDTTITDGTTDVAPSHNAVFDALAAKANVADISGFASLSGATMTGDLVMNGGSTSGIFLTAPSINHGMTDEIATNVGMAIQTEAEGGAIISGLSSDSTMPGVLFNSISNDPDTEVPSFAIMGYKKDGTTVQALGATDSVMSVSNANTLLFSIMGSGDVGIGVAEADYKLDVDGDVNIEGASSLRFGGTQVCDSTGCTSSSDIRLKENIDPLTNSLSNILLLQGVEYDYLDTEKFGDAHHVGLIAQDVEKVYPEVVKTDKKTGLKSVAYSHLVAPVIEAIKSLYSYFAKERKARKELSRAIASKAQVEDVEELKKENKKLRNQNKRIIEENKAIKERLKRIEVLLKLQ